MLLAEPRVVEWRGEIARLMNTLEDYSGEPAVFEHLVEGPRGTGKSRGLAFLLYELARRYEDCRILVIRKTRESLTESFCKVFEEDTCPGDPCIPEGDRVSRHHYQFDNGSRIVLGGLDKPTKHQSTDWDVIFCEEAVELTWRAVEPFFGALRNWHMPYQLMLYACNPDAPGHWLNKRAEDGKATRHRTYHLDNPLLYDYDEVTGVYTITGEGQAFTREALSKYVGVAHARHVLGLWKGAEGMVWENFDPEIHVIDAPTGSEAYKALGLKDFMGSLDWGFTAPGSLSIWGRDSDKRGVRVAQVYRTKQNAEWWAGRISDLDDEFSLLRVEADPSRNDLIDLVNDWLVRLGKRRLVVPADNAKASSSKGDLSGLDLVRWGFERDETGTPRLRFLSNALRFGRDEELHAAGKPIDTPSEIPEYVFARDAQGEILDDRTDDDCADHGCDETRYFCSANWKRRAPIDPIVPEFKPRSLGYMLDHSKEFKRTRRVRV